MLGWEPIVYAPKALTALERKRVQIEKESLAALQF